MCATVPLGRVDTVPGTRSQAESPSQSACHFQKKQQRAPLSHEACGRQQVSAVASEWPGGCGELHRELEQPEQIIGLAQGF